ncbi:MAG: carboxypeptidase regulatory-like domain-containing protein, partial [candidate division KSB1 bacterium]|nr:carboxypeptidase regulatory-like domain-containing protein [candidate division KSB1 bacterium]
LKNVGDSLATGVTATLHIDDPFILINDSLKSYGDIAPGDSTINPEPFLFTISPRTPNDHSLVFSLKVRDSRGNSWDSFFLLKVLQPTLTYLGYSIEEVTGDGDKIPDPGEVCHLFITLENHGLRLAKGVSATLSTRDPDITVNDRDATFTDIPVDSSGHNYGDPFTFVIQATALPHLVQFQLQVSEGEGYYQKQLTMRILLEQGPVLLVIDDGQADNSRFYLDALKELGVPARTWSVAIRGSVPLDTLRNQADVIWFTGAEARETLTPEDQANLGAFLNQGGHLLLSGDFIGLRLATTPFYKDYLHARFVNVQPLLHHLRGVKRNPVTDIDTLALVASSATLPTWPTEIDPLPPAFSVFTYDTTTAEGHGIIKSSGTAALAVDTGTFKLVYCSFGLESIISLKTRATFLEDVLSWFKGAPIDLRAILSVASFTIDDDSSGASLGDGDGFINPGERIELSLSLANEGDLAASKVLVTLRTTDDPITIIDSTATFTIISQHSVASSTDNFGFQVEASAPHEHEVPFEVSITDSAGNHWSDRLLLTIQHSNTITGRVTDVATGQGIPAAEISWSGSIEEQTGQVSTNESGHYSLSLPIGLYTLTATAKGYVPSEPVYVELPPDTSLDFVLTSPELAATPDSFVIHLNAGEFFQDSLIISNTGTGRLFYSLLEISPTVAKVSQPPVARLVGESPTKILSPGVRLSISLPTPTASADVSLNKGTSPNPGQWKLMHLDADEPETTLDLNKFYIQNDSKDIFFKQTVHQAWNNPTSELMYIIFMDTDMNSGTGASINNIGADYAIALGYLGNLILRWTPANEDFNPIPGTYIPHHVVLPLQADSLEVGIHLTQIGNPKRLDIVTVMMTPDQMVKDVAPDNGLYHIPYSTFDAGWLRESSFYGVVESGASDTLLLNFTAEGLASGSYKTCLVIENNQPEGAARVIPVQLTVGPTGVAQVPVEVLPEVYELHQNYPNPFSVGPVGQSRGNFETVIKYQLPKDGEVVLKVYNMLGQEVATLVQEHKKAGYYEARWDGKDQYGRMCASGIYFYRITAGSFVQTRKMLLLQ